MCMNAAAILLDIILRGFFLQKPKPPLDNLASAVLTAQSSFAVFDGYRLFSRKMLLHNDEHMHRHNKLSNS